MSRIAVSFLNISKKDMSSLTLPLDCSSPPPIVFFVVIRHNCYLRNSFFFGFEKCVGCSMSFFAIYMRLSHTHDTPVVTGLNKHNVGSVGEI